jgi:hypothetical protein
MVVWAVGDGGLIPAGVPVCSPRPVAELAGPRPPFSARGPAAAGRRMGRVWPCPGSARALPGASTPVVVLALERVNTVCRARPC